MTPQGIVSVVALVLGVVVIVVLVSLGGVTKKLIDDSVTSRLEYKLPDGYKNNPDYQECYRNTEARFWEEYYVWNLTNLADVLAGGTANYSLVGPFAYTRWYCDYDHSINKAAGLLQYRTIEEGYVFLPDDSISDDSVLITNVNPGYAGLLQTIGSESNLPVLIYGPGLEKIITAYQNQSIISFVWLSAVPATLTAMNEELGVGIIASLLNQTTAANFFNPGFYVDGIQGWAYYTLALNASADVSLSTTSENAIFTAWTTGATLIAFASLDVATVSTTYGVTLEQAGTLLYYAGNYLLTPANFGAQAAVNAILAEQWANGTGPSFYPGWEVGIPTATNISAADVAHLFDPTYGCSLTGSTGIESWLAALLKGYPIDLFCPGFLSDTQRLQIEQWLVSYSSTVVNPILLRTWQLSSWNDFSYAQWGSLIAGQSLGPVGGLLYDPEIAAFTSSAPGFTTACVTYTTQDAKVLLNGTNGLFTPTNMVTFFTLFSEAQQNSSIYQQISALWPSLSPSKAYCLYLYLSDLLFPNAINPVLEEAMNAGGSYFTTRTVREWLFTAQDPLLELLGQSADVAFVGNKTVSKAVADTQNYTYLRIYTGDNDLHYSLMPVNDGEILPFWRGDVPVTGYNGSQFLTNGYLDQDPKDRKYPLNLWNHLINRSIPFVNAGKDSWDGVHIRYLTMDPAALENEVQNPDNYAYYSVYGGAINKTSNPPYLPLYLTTPNFLSAEAAFSENVTIHDGIFTDYDPTVKLSRHRLSLFILAEPTLGSAVWGNLPIQVNLKYGPTALYNPLVKPAFAPVYWNAIGNIASKQDLDQIKSKLYVGQLAWKVLIGVGVGFGTLCLVGGIVGVHHYRKHKNELKDLPTTTVTTVSSSNSN